MRTRVVRVHNDFADELEKLFISMNGLLEKKAKVKFKEGDMKPISRPLITRIIAKQINPDIIQQQIEIDLRKFILKI